MKVVVAIILLVIALQCYCCESKGSQSCENDLTAAIDKLISIQSSASIMSSDIQSAVEDLLKTRACLSTGSNENPDAISNRKEAFKSDDHTQSTVVQTPVTFGRVPMKPTTAASHVDEHSPVEKDGFLILNSAVESMRKAPLSIRLL